MTTLHIIEKANAFRDTDSFDVKDSHAWKLNANERGATHVAFHKSKKESAYMTGKIIKVFESEVPGRWVIRFVIEPMEGVMWEGRKHRMAYKSLV